MRGRAPAAVLVLVAAVGLTGCGSGHHRGSSPRPATTVPTAPTPIPVTEISFGLEASAPSNWNVLAAGNDTPALTAIADQVWPSVYDFGPSYTPVLDTTLVTSAVTSSSLTTVVYHINPKAIWSDGTPVAGTDFVYNWQVQADRGGYNRIRSVKVSTTDPDVVTVSFSSADPDWQGLFSHLIPAHVAEHVGFASGFTDPVAELVSGGPYVVQSYDPGRSVRLVRNPTYAGPAATATALDFDFLADQAQVSTTLAAGQVTCAQVDATSAVLLPLETTHRLTVTVASGSSYLDLDFKESDPALASASQRAAIAAAVNPAAVAAAVGGAAAAGVTAVTNRFLVSGELGYRPDGPVVAATPPSVTRGSSLRLESGADALSAAVEKVIAAELRANIDPWTGPDSGDVLLLGWGGTFGAIKAATIQLQQEGIKAAAGHVRYLNPLPKRLGEIIKRFKHVLVPELNLGQFRMLLRDRYLIDAKGLNKVKGQPFSIHEIVDGAKAILAGRVGVYEVKSSNRNAVTTESEIAEG